jgi:hypothetical protein
MRAILSSSPRGSWVQARLLLEQHVDDREKALFGRTARQHEGRQRQVVEGELPEDVAHRAGVDEFLLQRGKRIDVVAGAVGTGGGGIFDDGHRRVFVAERALAELGRLLEAREIAILGIGFAQARHLRGGERAIPQTVPADGPDSDSGGTGGENETAIEIHVCIRVAEVDWDETAPR